MDMNPRILRTYGTPQAAYIAQGMLEANGIKAYVSENASESVFPAPDGGISSTALYVDSPDYDRAMDLLREHGD